MKQILNGYMEKYYLLEDGRVFDKDSNTFLKTYRKHSYRLYTKENKLVQVSIKTLYRMVYEKEYCIDSVKNLEGELWKELPQSDGRYFVSNKGRIKSYWGYEAIILKPFRVNGYGRVDIIYDGIRLTKLVSRLVAQTWIEQPDGIDYQLHHIDGNRKNNDVNNLIWLSPLEHKRIHSQRRKENVSSKLEGSANKERQ